MALLSPLPNSEGVKFGLLLRRTKKDELPLMGAKRKSISGGYMSAYSQEATFEAAVATFYK